MEPLAPGLLSSRRFSLQMEIWAAQVDGGSIEEIYWEGGTLELAQGRVAQWVSTHHEIVWWDAE